MGTRGCYGLYKNGVTKATYNHFDSYIGGLGKDILDFVGNTSIPNMNKMFEKIILVNEDDIPTIEQIENCQKYTDLDVSNKSIMDFYCLLRNAQGDLNAYKTDLKYMIDSKEFLGNSLFCEYAYIINLDKNVLEFYKGFNEVPQNNRYSKYASEEEKYKECKLLAEYPLTEIYEGKITLDNMEEDLKKYREEND